MGFIIIGDFLTSTTAINISQPQPLRLPLKPRAGVLQCPLTIFSAGPFVSPYRPSIHTHTMHIYHPVRVAEANLRAPPFLP